MLIYVEGGVGPSRSGCLQNGVHSVEPDENIFKVGFHFFCSMFDQKEICSRMLEGKEMGFKVVKVAMSPRFICVTRNQSAVTRVFR